MALATFDLLEGEYVIDGEYDLARRVLIRRPPIMLRLGYLERMYENNHGSLGTLLQSGVSADGKLMVGVPEDHFRLFDEDVELRKWRRDRIKAQLEEERSSKLRGDLAWEAANIIDGWLGRYEDAVARVEQTKGAFRVTLKPTGASERSVQLHGRH